MSIPTITVSPSTPVDFIKLVKALPKAKDKTDLYNLSAKIFDIHREAAKAKAAGTPKFFFNIPKTTLENGRLYKIHAFSHPELNQVNVYVAFPKKKGDEISVPEDHDSEVSGSCKVFQRNAYQIQFVGDRLEMIKPVGKLSGNWPEVKNHSLCAEIWHRLKSELAFLMAFADNPDVCKLEDGVCYRGKHTFYDAASKQFVQEDLDKVVMYQELYDSDLLELLDKQLKTKPIKERLTLLAPALYRLLRGTATMHAAKVVHQDLKADNLFLKPLFHLGRDIAYASVIGDLGHARKFDDASAARFGTKGYSAPEIYKGSKEDIGAQVDSWNAGYIFFVILNQKLPEWIPLMDCLEEAIELKKLANYKVDPVVVEDQSLQDKLQVLNVITEHMLEEVTKVDANQLVNGILSNKTLEKVLSYLLNYRNFLDENLESLSTQQLATARGHVESVHDAVVKKCHETWLTLDQTPCPVSQDPKTLEEAVVYLTWRMLKSDPQLRITPAEALTILSRFADENGILSQGRTLFERVRNFVGTFMSGLTVVPTAKDASLLLQTKNLSLF